MGGRKKSGFISGLVNCAGISGGTIVEELSEDEMDSIMHVNYTATVLLSQLIYRKMKTQEEGAIVNVSSLSGLRALTATRHMLLRNLP